MKRLLFVFAFLALTAESSAARLVPKYFCDDPPIQEGLGTVTLFLPPI